MLIVKDCVQGENTFQPSVTLRITRNERREEERRGKKRKEEERREEERRDGERDFTLYKNNKKKEKEGTSDTAPVGRLGPIHL